MIDGMSVAEFRVRFPEPSARAARLYGLLGTQVYGLLWLVAGMLSDDYGQLRSLMATILVETNRGNDTVLLRRLGLQLLGLAYPAIDENHPEIKDRIERFLTESGDLDEDDIPY